MYLVVHRPGGWDTYVYSVRRAAYRVPFGLYVRVRDRANGGDSSTIPHPNSIGTRQFPCLRVSSRTSLARVRTHTPWNCLCFIIVQEYPGFYFYGVFHGIYRSQDRLHRYEKDIFRRKYRDF